MLVRFMPELGKYAMDSSTVTLLFLLVFVSMVTKDILEAKKLLKRYEAYWIYPFLSVVLLIGFALNTDIILNLFIMLELAACVNLWILEYRRYKKARNGMESCTLYIPILPDNTVIVENPMMDGEMKVLGFMFYNTRTMEYETYGTVSDEHLRMSEIMIQSYIKRSWTMNQLMHKIVHCHAYGKVIFQMNMMSCCNT